MKNKGKKMGLAGTIVMLLLYVILQWTGIIHPRGDEGQESIQYQESMQSGENIQKPEETKTPESAVNTQENVEIAENSENTQESEENPESFVNAQENTQQVADNSHTQESSEAGFHDVPPSNYEFRNQKLEDNHYKKHGIEMGFDTVDDYIAAANKVIDNPDALYKLEAEDDDHIYFIEETNEFVVLSQDGYIRTYYIADGGIDYFNRQ